MQPDEETKNRIKNLAVVGRALDEVENETGGQTDFYLAKSALQEFEAGINRLQLDPPSKQGMDSLIKILKKMLEDHTKEAINPTY